ncbi:MAG: NAD(P)H-dependent oxidoreductase [Ilumatobacteraceae bacterium]
MTDSPTFTAVAFSGSLRRDSSNTGLVNMAARLAPAELHVDVVNDAVFALPFYNADLEEDVPPEVQRWRDLVTAADAVIIGMPEYNFGPSAVAKNAIDWVSRPFGALALTGKVIAMLTSGGKGGGSRVQAGIGPILGLLGNTVVEDSPVHIALGADRIQADGTTADPDVEAAVLGKLDALLRALRGATAGDAES